MSDDPMAPDQLEDPPGLAEGEFVNREDYEALWDRCQKAEGERDARAETGYAVQADALRKQLVQQREDFERRVTELKVRAERAEAKVAVADELADAAREYLNSPMSYLAEFALDRALARFREPREIPGFEGTKEGLEVMAAAAALVTKNREANRSVSTDENTEEEA